LFDRSNHALLRGGSSEFFCGIAEQPLFERFGHEQHDGEQRGERSGALQSS